MEAMQNTKEVT